jgi:N-terminal domain of anti-restriction factor ArdC
MTTTTKARLTDDEKAARLEEAHAMIASAVAAITSSDDWKRYMQFARAFHHYSFNNILLMMVQADKRDMAPLTHVAGFRRWAELKHPVSKGEKGLRIFAPMVIKLKEGDQGYPGSRVVGFRLTTVFDVQQTEGDAAPVAPVAQGTMSGTVARGALTALGDHAQSLGYPWRYGNTGKAEGHTDMNRREIVISSEHENDDAQTFAILSHEVAHATLHTDGDYEYAKHRGVAETEAESVAYIVAGMFGVDMSDTSFHYVAGWARDPEVVVTAGTRIMKTAKAIIDLIEKEIV